MSDEIQNDDLDVTDDFIDIGDMPMLPDEIHHLCFEIVSQVTPYSKYYLLEKFIIFILDF